MIKKLLSYILFGASFIGNAQTPIAGGNVFGSWTLSGSPYQILGSIMIPDNSTLTIEPGVIVEFQGVYKLLVQGRLIAYGSISDTIIFTASDTITGWKGIQFDDTPSTNDTSKIFFCKLQYANVIGTSPNNYSGALFFNNFSKVIVSQSCIVNNSCQGYGGGICCSANSNPILSYNLIKNNVSSYDGGGIYIISSSPTIRNNSITDNKSQRGAGIYCLGSTPIINSNTISNNIASNVGGGIKCSYGGNANISNNIISQNSGSDGGAIYCNATSNPTIYANFISNNSASNVYTGAC